ncbi:MTCH2 family protein [Megaselia abdita]
MQRSDLEKRSEYSDNKEVNEWIHFGFRLAVSSTLHPLDYSKVLIQLGYEPIPSKLGKSFLGKPVQFLPNIFSYAGYIRQNDGFLGMYRGLTPKLAGALVSIVLSDKIADRLGFSQPTELDIADLDDDQMYSQFKYNLKRDVLIQVSGVILSHPFHVISVRMMAQFIGRETVYKSLIGSAIEIYKDGGILGFFSGIIPKLLFEVACLVLSNSTVYIINKYLIKDKMARQYNTSITQFAFASILYPLQVVSTCMIVSGSR